MRFRKKSRRCDKWPVQNIRGLLEIIFQLFKGDFSMDKAKFVSDAVATLQAAELQAQTDVISSVVDQVLASVPASTPGTFTQADVDAAKAQGGADVTAQLQPKIDDLTAHVQSLQMDDDAKTATIQKILALLAPPAPVQS